jgi:acyl carrier protein
MSNEEIFKKMQELVAEEFAMDPDEITMETSFEEDLSADSVDLVELVMAMEEEFDVGETQEEELSGLKTVGDAVQFVAGKLNA